MAGLHVHHFGPADGRPLLALHGIRGYGGRWWQLAETRLPDFRVYAPDLRGHGHSPDEPPWTLERFAADLIGPAGILLVARGQVVTASLLHRIRDQWSDFARAQKVRATLPC